MKIEYVLTNRKIQNIFYWDIVYEWEDVISKNLGIPFVYSTKFLNSALATKLHRLFSVFLTNKECLQFEMVPSYCRIGNKRNIIPWIIDFYPTEDILSKFVKSYNKSAAVLISSRQVYQWLVDRKCPLNIQHLALSLSDKYRLDKNTRYKKKYDLIVTGRKNPVLMEFLKRYIVEHPDFTYIYLSPKDGHQCYCTSKGEFVGIYDSREDYMKLLKEAKVAFYSTSGVDGDSRKGTNGFNQVTPKFLEFLSSGCYVISRFVDNEDTDYYEMDKYSMRATDYEQFEKSMDYALSHEFDYEKIGAYLEKHYTSTRSEQLKGILKTI